MFARHGFLCAFGLFFVSIGVAQEHVAPKTPRFPVVDHYHRGQITDPYRWLEEIDSLAVRKWVEQQNHHAEQYFERSKHRDKLEKKIRDLYEKAPPEYRDVQFENGVIVCKLDEDLVVLESTDQPKPKHLLVSLSEFIPNKEVSIDLFLLSPTGKRVAALISVEGLEEGTLYFFDTETGKRLADEIPFVSASPGGNIAWRNDGAGIYYTKYPYLKENTKRTCHSYANQEIWLHEIGDDSDEDTYVCGRELPRYSQLSILAAPKENHLIVFAPTGWGAEGQSIYTWTPANGLNRIASPEDKICNATYGPDRSILLESCRKAPRGQMLRISMDDRDLSQAKVIRPENEAVLYTWWCTKNLIYLVERMNGRETIRIIDIEGKDKRKIELPPQVALVEMATLRGDRMLYLTAGYIDAPKWTRYDPDTDESIVTDMSEKWDVHFDDCEVIREWATSKDGTKVPLDIIRRKDCKLDSSHPVLLNGYGGFKFHEQANFQPYRRLWLDAGAIWVVAHPRGEGELGEEWYQAGIRENKIKSAEDFIACAEYLIDKKYTLAEKIGIMGGSNGGLLVGMAVTQRPELFGAVIGNCGVYDLLRLENEPFGPHLATEYGTVTNGKHFKAMKDCSPYHQINPKQPYPAIWLRTGGNDRRVTPWHSWKMAAMLQETRTTRPILVTTYPKEGHNFAGSIIDEATFLYEELKIK